MYAPNAEQAVKMRGLARRMRHDAQETHDIYYQRLFSDAARELDEEAERLERSIRISQIH